MVRNIVHICTDVMHKKSKGKFELMKFRGDNLC